jgi:hypothetical protein
MLAKVIPEDPGPGQVEELLCYFSTFFLCLSFSPSLYGNLFLLLLRVSGGYRISPQPICLSHFHWAPPFFPAGNARSELVFLTNGRLPRKREQVNT